MKEPKEYVVQIWDSSVGHWKFLLRIELMTFLECREMARELSEWSSARVVQVSPTLTYKGKPAVIKVADVCKQLREY